MNDKVKDNIKKLAQEAEFRFTRSVLRWKYKKEGKPVPREEQLEQDSREVADRARRVIGKRARNIWEELKGVYLDDTKKGDSSKE